MRRALCVLLAVVILLCSSACVGQNAEDFLYEQLSAFNEEFNVHTDEVNALFTQVLTLHPEMQVYIGQVSIESTAVRHKVKVEYENKHLKPETVMVGSQDVILTKALSSALRKVQSSGAVVLLSQGTQPDPTKYVDGIKEKEYLSAMGLRASKWTFTTNNFTQDMVVHFSFEYTAEPQALQQYRRDVEKEVQRLAGVLWNEQSTPVERVRSIHDYVVQNTRYAETEEGMDHTPYNVLLQGSGVCDGYTFATHLLLQAAGVESRIVTGTAKAEEHAWNMVKIEGRYYHMDVTWDDPVGSTDMIIYDYFLKGDQTMQADHRWDTATPPCNTDYPL